MFPRSTVGRLVASLWLAACIGVLVFGYVQQHIHDMPVAFTWLMIYLTFPVGMAGAAFVGMASSFLSEVGVPYHPFWHLMPYWLVLVVLGYAQWFVVLPLLVRKVFGVRSVT
ncbi:MAG: hypothetical protein Q8M51_13475 [Polaromonas sp.]|nr:hypothetical protein [Polaromonas sp.]MDP3752292.1 hypothetical protein [Polaromonas sp.]